MRIREKGHTLPRLGRGAGATSPPAPNGARKGRVQPRTTPGPLRANLGVAPPELVGRRHGEAVGRPPSHGVSLRATAHLSRTQGAPRQGAERPGALQRLSGPAVERRLPERTTPVSGDHRARVPRVLQHRGAVYPALTASAGAPRAPSDPAPAPARGGGAHDPAPDGARGDRVDPEAGGEPRRGGQAADSHVA